MISLIGGALQWLCSKPEVAVPIVGLDNAGKTTLLEQAKALFNRTDSRRMSIDKIPPTIGMNIAKMDIAGSTVTFWDLGGHMKRIWKQYYEDANGIICVLDATDDGRLAEVKTVIREILQTPELSRKPLLVLANKRDIPGSHDAAFVTQHILPDLAERRKERAIRILAVSALSCEGLEEALKWIAIESAKMLT